jgi:NADPH:quinone reductase-like Zn-dependent oxidoreductase
LVKSYALNFRDVFAVLKPSPEFEKMNTVGIDWSGVVVANGNNSNRFNIGDRVFGTNLNGDALPSHVQTEEDLLMPIPDKLTFNEAATVPAVAATAYMCLIEVAKLTKEDTILIHTASGGVGLVAVQIAKSIGATIVATAGNKRKRAYLRTLGIQHIFHSRNTNYEKEIRTALGGRGVDVVLNSLTSTGFKEASLSVCNEGARFIEMSKLNTWRQEEVKGMRSDVLYTIVDLSAASSQEMKGHLTSITALMNKETIKPIPYCRFDVSEVREALSYLQKAKHVGKIVVTMPEPENEGLIPMFSESSTYLVTGGLGGIGMEVAKWMAQSGAKHVALVGRSLPNDKALEEMKRINGKGNKNVFSLQYDVGDEEQCQALIDR